MTEPVAPLIVAPPLIVGIGGTTRPGSSTELALRASLTAAQALGCFTQLFGGEALMRQPIYDPADPEARELRADLVEAVRKADGIIIASPGYHGSISGLVKNALDGLEDLRSDDRPYLDGRAVGLIVCAEGAQAGGSTLAALRSIVHALRGWPTPFAAVMTAEADCAPADDPRLALIAEQVCTFARRAG